MFKCIWDHKYDWLQLAGGMNLYAVYVYRE